MDGDLIRRCLVFRILSMYHRRSAYWASEFLLDLCEALGLDILHRGHQPRILSTPKGGHTQVNSWWDVLCISQDTLQVVSHQAVVGTVLVVESLQVVVDVLDLLVMASRKPELLVGSVETGFLNVFNLVHGIVLLLAPFQLLVQEVEDHEVEGPEVISPREVLQWVGGESPG